MMRVRFAVAVVAAAVGVGLGISGCNVLLDASDYAVGPNDASASTTGADGTATDGGAHSSDASQASPDAGTIGDPCVTNSDCAKGTCGSNSWCTMACTTNAACGSNSGDGLNYCVPTGTGSAGTCAPGCTTSDDCLVYDPSNPSTVCAPISTTNATTVCSVPQATGDDGGDEGSTGGGSGAVGDPCLFDSDCASNHCFESTWCTASCTSTSDTSCGYASSEAQNYCEHGAADGGLQCYTGCGTTSDCYLLSGTVCQPKGNASVCNVTAGAIGDPCETGSGSVYTACAAESDGGAVTCNDDGFCSRSCTTNAQCGTNTSGSPNYCLQMGGSGPTFCVPGCTQDGDCADLAGTFCSPVSGSATEFACATTGGQIGDPCEYDSDCLGDFSSCGDQYTCTQSCDGPSDTSCGSNSQGTVNACAYDEFIDDYTCFAPCTTDAQCTPYSNASEEPSSCTLISGSYVCANSDATTFSVTIQVKRHRRTRRHH